MVTQDTDGIVCMVVPSWTPHMMETVTAAAAKAAGDDVALQLTLMGFAMIAWRALIDASQPAAVAIMQKIEAAETAAAEKAADSREA